jgi:molecular chaperone GrpE (heat shock protein)
MRKKLVILGLVLFVPGAAVLGWLLAEERREQQKIAYYKLKYSSKIDEYVKQCNEWLQLSPEERAELPLELDEYGKTETKAQLQQQQRERLEADLDKLAAGEIDVSPFSDILYGKNWQNELSKYKKQKELNELAFSASILCTLTGGAILTLLLLPLTARFLIRGWSGLVEFAVNRVRGQRKTKAKQPVRADAKAKAKTKAKVKVEAKGKVRLDAEAGAKAKAKRKAKAKAEKLAKAEEKAKAKAEAKEKVKAKAEARVKAKAKRKAKAQAEKLARVEDKARAKAEAKEKIRAEAEARAKAKAERKAQAEAEKRAKAEEKVGVEGDAIEDGITLGQQQKQQGSRGQVKKHSKVLINSDRKDFEADSAGECEQALPRTACSVKGGPGVENSAKNAEEIALLLSDEKSIELLKSLKAVAENENASPKLEDSLKAQTESFEKQMAEFRQMAQGVQQTAIEHSEPLSSTLNELTQEVSAIRKYAASQQGRLEKLQDGYDWNIIRTFCLRVIRCIDNLESRISRLDNNDTKVTHLEEVRDELIFALESSGIEQFEPEINSDYRGQEKCAEAVKDKQHCDNPEQAGKIATVIRPGYQYFINEENVKVVRPAQVKLFA